MKVKIFNVNISCLKGNEFFEKISAYLSGKEPQKIAKINTEFLLRAKTGEEFQKTLSDFDLKIADGIGVLWAARFLTLPVKDSFRFLRIIWQAKYSLLSLIFYPKFCSFPIPTRIPGVEALYLMLEAAVKTESPVYFLGARPEVNQKAVEKIKEKLPDLKIAGTKSGYWKNDKEIVDLINESQAKLLVVALGSPKQEYWIRDHIAELKNIRVAVGEGGSLDFIAGAFRRAPKWMQKIGLEWLWRLFMNRSKSATGSRTKRVWNAVPIFIYQVVKYKLKYGVVAFEEN